MEDERLTVASKALAKGWKMLSKHCDSCGLPLFLVDDREVCVYCRDETLEKKESAEKMASTGQTEGTKNIEDVIHRKLNELLQKLDKETEIIRMKDILESIEMCVRILKNLNSMKK